MNDDTLIIAQRRFVTKLTSLNDQQLLRASTVFTLAKTFHNTVPVHRMRSTPIHDKTAKEWDDTIDDLFQRLTNITTFQNTQRTILTLPVKRGGLGVQTMTLRRHQHYWAAWRNTANTTPQELYATCSSYWIQNNATTAKWLHQAANAINIAHDTREYTPNWDAWVATHMPHPARTLNHEYHEQRQTDMLARITDIERAVHRAMGQEGGHFLEPPPDAPIYMPDDHY
jgi:hypothetical protein